MMSRDSYWPSLLYLSLTTLQHGLSNCSLNRSSLVINGSQGRPPNLSFAAFTQADQRSLDLLSSLGLEANPSARLIYSFLLSQVLLMISIFLLHRSVTFVISKKLGAGTYALELENKVGRAVSAGFTVTGPQPNRTLHKKRLGIKPQPFLLVRPAGRIHLEVKVLYGP